MKLVFYISGLVAIISTLFVIFCTKAMHALLFLIILLLSISCIFFSIGSYFAGVLEVIIYAGAIMVLFVFIIMTINIDTLDVFEIKPKYTFSFFISCFFPITFIYIIVNYFIIRYFLG